MVGVVWPPAGGDPVCPQMTGIAVSTANASVNAVRFMFHLCADWLWWRCVPPDLSVSGMIAREVFGSVQILHSSVRNKPEKTHDLRSLRAIRALRENERAIGNAKRKLGARVRAPAEWRSTNDGAAVAVSTERPPSRTKRRDRPSPWAYDGAPS